MRHFERVGCEWQDSAMNVPQAVRSFKKSCELCITRGYNIDCDRCEIRAAHKVKLDVLKFLEEERIAKARVAAESISTPPIRPVRITIVV